MAVRVRATCLQSVVTPIGGLCLDTGCCRVYRYRHSMVRPQGLRSQRGMALGLGFYSEGRLQRELRLWG